MEFGGISIPGSGWFLGIIENYLEGAGDSSSGANSFTLSAPVALFFFYNGDDIIDH